MGISTDERLLYDKIITLLRELIGGSGIALPAGAATEAKQDDVITELGNILTQLGLLSTAANQATTHTKLDAIVAALAGLATEAKQDVMITALGTLATETTLAAIGVDVAALEVLVTDIKTEQTKYGKFIQNGDSVLTVAAAAVGIEGPGSIPVDTVAVYGRCEGGQMRVRIGASPTASIGHLLNEGDVIKLGEIIGNDASEVDAAEFIRTGATSGTIQVLYLKRV